MRPSLYICGDSLTEYGFNSNGWILRLLADAGFFTVKNYGFAGFNTEWFINDYLPINVDSPDNTHVIIWFGANDCLLPNNPIKYCCQYVHPDLYAENLTKIVNNFIERKLPLQNIIILPPPPLASKRLPEEPIRRTAENTQIYVNKCSAVAEKLMVKFFNLYHALDQYGNWIQKYTVDGIHFNDDGNVIIASLIKSLLPKFKIEEPFLKWKAKVIAEHTSN